MEVTRAGIADLDEIVATRLQALEDAPDAFASTLERERSLGRDAWLSRMRSGAWWLARQPGGRPSGLVAGIRDPDEPSFRQLVSMWVEPAARGGPAAGALVAAVVDWAADEGAPAVVLWVVEGNLAARRLYDRSGFALTGRRQALRARPWVVEEQMIRRL